MHLKFLVSIGGQYMHRLLALILLLVVCSAQAAPITYDISWSHVDFWPDEQPIELSGSFTIDDSLLGTGIIEESSVLSMTIEGFYDGELVGSSSDLPEIFFFDTNTETFVIPTFYGELAPDGGSIFQRWGSYPTGMSFWFGNASSFIILNSTDIVGRPCNTGYCDLVATRSVVPIPAAMWLFGSGLAGLGWLRRKQIT